jgi:ABC-type sugar transport system permease subunit
MRGSRWSWRVLALPGVAWLSVFFLVALYAILAVAFGNQDTLSQPVPFWNPLDWNVGYVLETLKNIWHGGQFLTVSLRTIEFVVIAVGSRCSSAIRSRTTRPGTRAAGRVSSSSR